MFVGSLEIDTPCSGYEFMIVIIHLRHLSIGICLGLRKWNIHNADDGEMQSIHQCDNLL